jgi:Domain of unknown function (DUF1707)
MRPRADAGRTAGADAEYMTPIEEDTVQPNENWSAAGGRIRTSDQERERIAEILRAAMTEGRLTLEEGEERLAAVYAAKYRDDLKPLTADLPDQGRRALADTPEARQAARHHLRRHAGFVAFIALVLTGFWALSHAVFFWPAIPLFFLVMGLARHARMRRYGYGYGHRFDRGERVAPWNGPARW